MGLNKRTYVNGETVITAENLNEIQDSVIALEGEVPKKADASVIADPFDENETYTFGDLVTHDGKLYKCNTTDFIFGDWNAVAEYFDEVTIFDEVYTKAQTDSALALKVDKNEINALGLSVVNGCLCVTYEE